MTRMRQPSAAENCSPESSQRQLIAHDELRCPPTSNACCSRDVCGTGGHRQDAAIQLLTAACALQELLAAACKKAARMVAAAAAEDDGAGVRLVRTFSVACDTRRRCVTAVAAHMRRCCDACAELATQSPSAPSSSCCSCTRLLAHSAGACVDASASLLGVLLCLRRLDEHARPAFLAAAQRGHAVVVADTMRARHRCGDCCARPRVRCASYVTQQIVAVVHRFQRFSLTLPARARRLAMSSDVLARVKTFSQKADDLFDKGYLLRAAENFGRAAEAARPLGADNFVTLCMQLQKSNMLGSWAFYAPVPDSTAKTADATACAAHRAEFITLLSSAVEALERRRVAGKLLEGKCAAVEEAWYAGEWQLLRGADCTAVEAAIVGELVGFEMFMRAATHVANVLACARFFAVECSATQFQSFAQHVVRAAVLMQLPRRHDNAILAIEASFADELRYAAAEAGSNGLDARLVQLLASAWQRLQRSGVLQARCIEERIRKDAVKQAELQAAMQSSMTAQGLRTCALPGCGAKEAHPTHFKSCAACRGVVYCCREHQVAGWPSHKKACKAALKAAAAADEEDGAGPSGA